METLTLEQASYLAEIIGVVAVVGSIVYLALQLKASNQVSRISAFTTFSPRYENSFELLMQPENAKLYIAATEGYENLDDNQKLRFRSFFIQCTSVMEDFYFMSQMGIRLVDPTDRKTILHLILKTPGGRAAWKDIRQILDPGFRKILDDLAEAKGDKDLVI